MHETCSRTGRSRRISASAPVSGVPEHPLCGRPSPWQWPLPLYGMLLPVSVLFSSYASLRFPGAGWHRHLLNDQPESQSVLFHRYLFALADSVFPHIFFCVVFAYQDLDWSAAMGFQGIGCQKDGFRTGLASCIYFIHHNNVPFPISVLSLAQTRLQTGLQCIG